jgi:hypothetical protein
VDEAGPVHRLDDGVHLLTEGRDVPNEMGKAVRVGREGVDDQRLAGLVQNVNIDPAS